MVSHPGPRSPPEERDLSVAVQKVNFAALFAVAFEPVSQVRWGVVQRSFYAALDSRGMFWT